MIKLISNSFNPKYSNRLFFDCQRRHIITTQFKKYFGLNLRKRKLINFSHFRERYQKDEKFRRKYNLFTGILGIYIYIYKYISR